MARQKGTLNLSGTLEVKAGGPLDSRSLVPTLADLTTAANFDYPYVGMEVYVVSENKKYRLIATPVTSSSNWEEVGGSSGGGGLPTGGTTGQMLVKHSNTDGDAGWVDPVQVTTLPNAGSTQADKIYQYIGETANGYVHGYFYTCKYIDSEYKWIVSEKFISVRTLTDPIADEYEDGDTIFYVGSDASVSRQGKTVKWVHDTFYKVITDGGFKTFSPITKFDNSTAFKSTDTINDSASFFDDGTTFPYFDAANLLGRLRITWGGLKAKLKVYFDTLYSTVKTSKAASSGGTDLSLVTTGEKFNWNQVSVYANKFDRGCLESETEKIVGCMVDGRPIYQKTYHGTTPSNANTVTLISDSNAVLHDVFGVVYFGTSANRQACLIQHGKDSGNAYTFVAQDGNNIWLEFNEDFRGYPYNLTVRYWKKNDSSNSFKYADENDYSTTEHIVGTWIDGKPIYQKTVSFGALPKNTTKEVSHGISYLKRVIKIFGYAYGYDSGAYYIPIPYVSLDNTWSLETNINGSKITITSGQDWSGTIECYITIQYTKTTD